MFCGTTVINILLRMDNNIKTFDKFLFLLFLLVELVVKLRIYYSE